MIMGVGVGAKQQDELNYERELKSAVNEDAQGGYIVRMLRR